MLFVAAAEAEEAALVRQLSERCLHLESALQVSNAQLAVASLEKRSLQAAFDDATQQLTARETDAVLMGAQLATQEADLQVRLGFRVYSLGFRN